jgi:ABC-type branched-subunit amino acid transport system substrate-binding protein
MKPGRRAILAALAVLAPTCLIPAAPSTARGAQQGVTPSEIVLGVTSAFTGSTASLGVELYRGYAAYLQKVNEGGGVNGRRIRLVLLDDQYDPPRSVQNAIRLIETEKVFMLFGGVGTPTTVQILPLLKRYEERGVTMFSPFTGAQTQREAPYDRYVINVRASYREETEGLVNLLDAGGFGRIGVLYQSDSYGKSGQDGVARALAKRGRGIAAEATYARGSRFDAPMTRQVDILVKGGAQAIICVGSYEPCAAFVRDARNAGFKGPIANISFVGPEALLALLRTQETKEGKDYTSGLINSQVVPYHGRTELAAVREYQELIRQYSPSLPGDLRDPKYAPAQFSFGGLEGYLNARVLVEILRRIGTAEITAASFTAAAETMTELDVGLDVPIGFGPGVRQGSHKVYFTAVSGGSWTPLAGIGQLQLPR